MARCGVAQEMTSASNSPTTFVLIPAGLMVHARARLTWRCGFYRTAQESKMKGWE